MAEKLDAGHKFPSMTWKLVGGGTLTIPKAFDTKYNIVLFYRGHW
jgi:hypothetical protein